MPSEFSIQVGGASLRAASEGAGPGLIFLHAGVADRRMWRDTAAGLSSRYKTVTYDRRGFGETTTPDEAFRHIDDLHALIESSGGDPVSLVGCSQGGRIAIDYALAHPARVASLTLVGTALSGAQPPDSYPPDIAARLGELEQAEEDGDLDRVNAIEAHLWLDGPQCPDGRVADETRWLFLDMNSKALQHAPLTRETPPPPAIDRLGAIAAPAFVIWGDKDFPHIQARSAMIAATIPGSRSLIMAGCAHLPNLEQPEQFNRALSAFLASVA